MTETIVKNKHAHTPEASTVALHSDDGFNVLQDVAPPLHVSTNYRYSGNGTALIPIPDRTEEDHDPADFYYSRIAAPSTSRFEAIATSLLHAPTISYASGQSALLAALLLLNPSRVFIGDAYFGSHGVIEIISRMSGVQKLSLDCNEEELQPGDLILLETPLGPTGKIFRIETYAKKAHSRGAYLLVNSTFAPPTLQDPFRWGADLVMHSGSKFFGGHSDMLCGLLATRNKKWSSQLRKDRQFLGNIMGNFESWLGVRSLRTLEVRVQRQNQNAERLAHWLNCKLKEKITQEHEKNDIQLAIHRIYHASLESDHYGWMKEQMPQGFGSVFVVWTKTEAFARILPGKLKFFVHATSLGGVTSTIEWRRMSDLSADPTMLRLSIGLEAWEDLKDDFLLACKRLFEQV